MTLKEQVQSWIEWTRAYRATVPDIPKINSEDADWPWVNESVDIFGSVATATDNGEGLRHDLLDCFLENPGDIATRFTGLHLYGLLVELDFSAFYSEPFYLEYEVFEKTCWDFDRDRKKLFESFPVEGCAPDWPSIRWEINNSYRFGDCQRALRLYDLAAELGFLEPQELLVLRGEARFFAGSNTSPGDWDPKIHTPKDDPWGSFLLPFRVLELASHKADFNILCDAATDLTKALHERSDLSEGYRVMLAKCCFLTDRFHEAAEQYERILQSPTFSASLADEFCGHLPDRAPELREILRLARLKVYKSLANAHRRAEEPQNAIEVLERCVGEFPNERDVNKEIADIQKQEGNHLAAYESLLKETAINPEAGQDLGTSIALALGEIVKGHQDTSAFARRYVESNPETYQLTASLMGAYWDAFNNMEQEAQRKWVYGNITKHMSSGEGPLHQIRIHEAAALFAEATEIEVRAKIFLRFRENVTSKRELKELLARQMTGKKEERFYKFLSGRGFLALGDMCTIFELSANPKDEILKEFSRWLPRGLSPLVQRNSLQIEHLKKIYQYRNPVRHEGKLTGDPALIHSHCREILDLVARATRN